MNAKAFVLDPSDYPCPLKVVGEEITVLASGNTTGGYEIFLQEGVEGSGPNPHAHPWDGSFYVVKGYVNFNVGDAQTRTAAPGTLVHVPAGTSHWFRWKAGGGAMISITSKLGASSFFSDWDKEIPPGTRDPQTVGEIFGRHGVVRTSD